MSGAYNVFLIDDMCSCHASDLIMDMEDTFSSCIPKRKKRNRPGNECICGLEYPIHCKTL